MNNKKIARTMQLCTKHTKFQLHYIHNATQKLNTFHSQ